MTSDLQITQPLFPRPKILATLFFLAGLFYLALTPPGQVPDEREHFFRAFQISDGIAIGEKRGAFAGGEIPKAMSSTFQGFGDLYENPDTRLSVRRWKTAASESPSLDQKQLEDREYHSFAPMLLYSPVVYLPQAIGIRLARLFSLTAFDCFYLARIVCLAFASFCVFLCLKLLSFSKRLSLIFVVLVSMPMCLFQLSSVSADVVTDCLGFLCTAAVFSLHHRWERKVFWCLLLSAAGLSLCKTFYSLIPMAALPLILRVPIFDKPGRLKNVLLLVSCCFFPALIWSAASKGSYVPVRGNVPAQLSFVVGHPLFYLKALCGTVLLDWKWYLHSFVGILGPLTVPLPPDFVIIYFLTLIGVSLREQKPALEGSITLFNFGLVAVAVFILIFGQYLYWSYVGASHIEGVQGRYFIPLASLFFFSLPALRVKFLSSPYFTYYVWTMCLAAQIVSVRTLLLRYWL